MAIGLDSIWSSLKDGVTALQTVNTTIKNIFPQTTGTSTSAPASTGTITFTSSEASFFVLVTTSSGFTGKVPIYPQ